MACTDKDKDFALQWLRTHADVTNSFVMDWLDTHPFLIHRRPTMSTMAHTTAGGVEGGGRLLKRLNSFASATNLLHRVHEDSKEHLEKLKAMNKQSQFLELLKDVVSTDFDTNHLSHKMLVNATILFNCSTSSLFILEGTHLVSRLFNVTEHSTVEETLHSERDAIIVEIGSGIVGTVAETGMTLNIPDVDNDESFTGDKSIERLPGLKAKSVLCMPIQTPQGDIIGVAEIINKQGDEVFSEQDEETFKTYLTFCSIGLINSELFERSMWQAQKLEVLLGLAQSLIEEGQSLEIMMETVMLQSQALIPCEQFRVLFLEESDENKLDFSSVFYIQPSDTGPSFKVVKDKVAFGDIAIPLEVANTKEPKKVCNMSDSKADISKNILCTPIFSRRKHDEIIAIAELKSRCPFSKDDEESFEILSTFCGLSIHNAMSHEILKKCTARQNVALELLSYHASATFEDVEKILKNLDDFRSIQPRISMSLSLPTANKFNLTSFNFDDEPLSDDDTVMASVRMFIDRGLMKQFKISKRTVFTWVMTVKKNYRKVFYHNWRHAFAVAQSMFAVFSMPGMKGKFSDLEELALLIACFCHDLDHRGTNNEFQLKSNSPLADVYTTSTMENHHFDHCIMILNSSQNNILQKLTTEQYSTVIKYIKNAILSTDLSVYFRKKGMFSELAKAKSFCWEDEEHKSLLRGMLMTACDTVAITKPWNIQRRIAGLVFSEFFDQGDHERDVLNMEPNALMDRNNRHELPKMQVQFIDFVCKPLYESLAEFCDEFCPLYEGMLANRSNWNCLAERGTYPDDAALQTQSPLATGATLKSPVVKVEEKATTKKLPWLKRLILALRGNRTHAQEVPE